MSVKRSKVGKGGAEMSGTLERINELEGKARKALTSPALSFAAPGAKEAILELLEVVRGLAMSVENIRARQAIFENLKGENDGN